MFVVLELCSCLNWVVLSFKCLTLCTFVEPIHELRMLYLWLPSSGKNLSATYASYLTGVAFPDSRGWLKSSYCLETISVGSRKPLRHWLKQWRPLLIAVVLTTIATAMQRPKYQLQGEYNCVHGTYTHKKYRRVLICRLTLLHLPVFSPPRPTVYIELVTKPSYGGWPLQRSQVARLAAMYMEGDMNEADWYHRTEVKYGYCARVVFGNILWYFALASLDSVFLSNYYETYGRV